MLDTSQRSKHSSTSLPTRLATQDVCAEKFVVAAFDLIVVLGTAVLAFT